MNQYQKLLSCWHKLEHFSPSPAPAPNGKTIFKLNENEPWKIPYKSNDPKKTIEYTIYLGVFDSSVVNDFVKDYFKDTQKDENYRSSNICYASLKLDFEGKYLNESFGISTLPWALSQLEKSELNNDKWSKTFEYIKIELSDYISSTFKEISIDEQQLRDFQDEIDTRCGWSIKPKFQIYVKQTEKFKTNEPKSSTDILNSFYINDLEKIISRFDTNTCPKAFQEYLNGSLNKQSERVDVSKTIEVLRNTLSPMNYPDGCWPSDYTLSLMQQFAVNNIFNQLSDSKQEGLFSVNGPPGTGKTTLLKDIIAPIIVKRAKELSKLNNPSDGFVKVGTLKINDGYSPSLYAPIESISNGGIVIASSNNGAVENISKELPLKTKVPDLCSIEYFKNVAESTIGGENWGIITAVLGNKQNRTDFVNNVWYNFKDGETITLQKFLKTKKQLDNSAWETQKSSFNSKLKEVNLEKERLENFKKEYEESISTQSLLLKISVELENTKYAYINSKEKLERQRNILEELNCSKKEIVNELAVIKSSKPVFYIRVYID